jgi:polysaccharide biosynthesis/export protein
MFKKLRFLFFLCSILFSCVSHKKVIYFQDLGLNSHTIIDSTASLKNSVKFKAKPGAMLFILITSINKEVTEFYNLTTSGEDVSYLTLYMVDDSGNVTIPVLGKIQVMNLSLEQIQSKVLQKVRETVTDATVIVKLGSFKVTVLGDVKVPGIVPLDGERGTIFDVLALCGDMNETADRRHVKIIREDTVGKRHITMLDLTDKNILNSKNIYLQHNDLVYIEQLKAKTVRDNVSQIARFAAFGSIIYVVIRILNLVP